MNKMVKPRLLLSLAVLVPLFLIVSFLWQEATKEVLFLCPNFTAGTSQADVIRQLDTGNFLEYHTFELDGKRYIRVSSLMNFRMYRCQITLDETGTVISSSVY